MTINGIKIINYIVSQEREKTENQPEEPSDFVPVQLPLAGNPFMAGIRMSLEAFTEEGHRIRLGPKIEAETTDKSKSQ